MYYILVFGITLTTWETKWAEGVLGLQAVRRQFTSLGHSSKGDRHWRYMRVWQLAKTMLGSNTPSLPMVSQWCRYRPRVSSISAEGKAKEGEPRIASLQSTVKGRVLFMKGKIQRGMRATGSAPTRPAYLTSPL